MNRRTILQGFITLAAFPSLAACSRATAPLSEISTVEALNHPEDYWRDKVSTSAFEVLFEEETERPFSSPLNEEERDGTYICAACYLPLFKSEYKFESGTGWPSFTQPIEGTMGTKRDFLLLLPRTEYHCARCGGHQGHIFEDGPPPLGKRWCNNGLALQFVSQDQQLPVLRG